MEHGTAVSLPANFPPTLLVVVDTEEEFDWRADFCREATSIEHVRRLDRLQRVFDEFAIRPVYLVDYPIASQRAGVDALKPIFDDCRADLGAHLHVWVNPPFSEPLSRENSYQRNLRPELEREKLKVLKTVIEDAFGMQPLTHKAGRYGIGPSTAGHLAELGFEVDVSAAPAFDFRADGGPDFRHLGQHLFRFGPGGNLLGIPNTGAYIGRLAALGPVLYDASGQGGRLKSVFARALSRGRLVERIMLSPEGHTVSKLIRLTEALHAHGVGVFTFSFHSPTVMPGGTPYASSEREVGNFLDKCRRYFDYFLNELGGQTMLPLTLKSKLDAAS